LASLLPGVDHAVIHSRRTGALLAVVAILTMTTSAHGGGQWVLWMKTDYDAALEGDWELIQAFATRQDCVAAVQEIVSQPLDKAVATSGSVLAIGQGQSRLIKCLPDAVDPRREKSRLR
jgi:hypothetical protein